MDSELLLSCIVVLLIAVVVLLSIIVCKLANGFRTIFNYLRGIEDELVVLDSHLPSADEHREDDSGEPH